MANPSRKFRRRRWIRRGKREYIWSCINVMQDLVSLNGACDAFPIVVRDDWARDPARTSTLEKGAVLLRVTGDVRFSCDNGSGTYSPAGAQLVWGIGKFDEDDSTILDLANSFFGEDWMQVRAGTCWPNAAGTTTFAPQPWCVFPALDMRVKRKLSSEDEIRFVFGGYEGNGSSSTTTKLVAHYEFRSLIQLP